jgi:hypothetical protein
MEQQMRWSARFAQVLGAAAFVAGTPFAAAAATDPLAAPAGYHVVSIVESSAGRKVNDEFLGLQTANGNAVLKLGDTNGSFTSIPAKVESNGVVSSDVQDPAVVCYDMAARVVADSDAHSALSPLLVALGDTVVPVSMELHSAPGDDGATDITVQGSTAVADRATDKALATVSAVGAVRLRGGAIVAARFDQLTVSETEHAPISRSTCEITPLQSGAEAQAQHA